MDTECINTIKAISVDMIQKANSGHPGMPLGCAALAHILWTRIMKYNPDDPEWINRDRFILSNGHGCALLYTMLHLAGYDYTIDDLKQFRQLKSKTPGHPEKNTSLGIEVTTGPLGQGFSNGVGMAMTGKHLQAKYNKENATILDNFIYVMCGDGCLMEGISYESASLAGHLGLGNLIVLYDDNNITIDGNTLLTFTEDINTRFESMNWHVDTINDTYDFENVEKVIRNAQCIHDKPSLIRVKTTIGEGSLLQGTSKSHGAPLKLDDVRQLKTKLNFNPDESFIVNKDVRNYYNKIINNNKEIHNQWCKYLDRYEYKYNNDYTKLIKQFNNNYDNDIINMNINNNNASLATRQTSGLCLNSFCKMIPSIIGGSADLAGSNCSRIKDESDFQKNFYANRNINFGVREHAMFGIANGMHAYGGTIPYVATFLNFLTYGFGAVRLSALSKHQVIYLMTHDSIGLGEDGPTHQPIEVLGLCRMVPNLYTFRPADGNEVLACYKQALLHKTGPSVLSLTRQTNPNLENSSEVKAQLGGYIVYDEDKDKNTKITLIATGSEVSIAIEIAKMSKYNIRVVSMPCYELFSKQSLKYRANIIDNLSRKISIEAGSTQFWKGITDHCFGIDTFGESAPGKHLYEHFGLTALNLNDKINKLMEV